jgi:polyribonucleotide nucleotidyltransferase
MSDKTQFITETVNVSGKEITFEVGRFAAQATAAVVGRLGDSMVLVTVVGGGQRDDIDWFPLQVEFQEKLYAGGKIKGSRWVKREGRPSDEVILTSRVIDRSIRPLFSNGFKAEVQVVITPLSADGSNDLDVLSLCTVSAALSISGLPWEGPISGLRVGLIDGKYVAFPTFEEQEKSSMDIIIATTREAVSMVEAGLDESSEEEVLGALEFASEQSIPVIEAIERLVAKVGKPKMEVAPAEALTAEVLNIVEEQAKPIIAKLLKEESAGKINKESLYEIVDGILEKFENIKKAQVLAHLDGMFKQAAREQIINTKTRLDGRGTQDIRPLNAEVGMIPRTHGSGMFHRGETQALTLTTLASPRFSQIVELMDQEIEKRYMHHYIMPPFSVGETGRIGFPSRREIGHGALAERALVPVLPAEEDFPYAIRLVSECVSSNGSTSMASVCGSTLSLMDAGVPIKKPVAGIAMGLMVLSEQRGIVDDEYVVLTDIQGLEDHIGDMDFKVAGTRDGITALQMDIKVKGVTTQVLSQALKQAKDARFKILDVMAKAIDKPRDSVSQFAPKIETMQIKPEQIGKVIGSAGKIIKEIIETTGADVDINDEGRVVVTAVNQKAIQEAIEWIEGLTREVQMGEEFKDATVTSVVDFGAFVEILPGREGLVHVSQMSTGFVSKPHDIVS